jgi:hypothetical protein
MFIALLYQKTKRETIPPLASMDRQVIFFNFKPAFWRPPGTKKPPHRAAFSM